MDMTGTAVLVTGAASGMGRATAVRFAERGAASIACLDIHDPGNQDTARLVEKAGARALAVHLDLGDVTQIRTAYAEVVGAFGRIDAAAHIGGYSWQGNTLDVTVEQWDAVVDVNLRGSFFCCREALRVMYAQGGGAIVNMSADAAFFPMVGFAVQAAAKGGIAPMTKTLALEAARRGVRVNAVSPGIVKVDKTGTDGLPARPPVDPIPRLPGEVGPADLESQTAPGRYLRAEEIADTFVFLSSASASGINGEVVFVNGGGYLSLQLP